MSPLSFLGIIIIFSLLFAPLLPSASFADEEVRGGQADVSPSVAESFVVAEAAPLSDNEMDDLRGGFIDPSGLIYRFAVDVRTDLNGLDVFNRSINVTPTGPNGQWTASTSTALLPKNVPSNVSVAVLGNGSGLTLTDPSGNVTTVMNQTASGAPASIVLNTASNRQIAQSVSVTLALRNLSSVLGMARLTAQGAAMAQGAAVRAMGL